jgi:uncharacterized protein YceH (UPF0502 family)
MRTRKLDPVETRVLGALMEKEVATPGSYPLTINAVIAACNQKSNRVPVMVLTETEVVEALDRLREDVLTWRSDGARVERWQHSLDRRWELDPASKAIMCLLMLRGPQTGGELKSRSDRLHQFDSSAEVEKTLRSMAERFDALTEELPRFPGQRETRWRHLALADEYVEAVEAQPAVTHSPRLSPVAVPEGPKAIDRLEVLETTVEDLMAKVEALEEELLGLRKRLGDLD